MRPHYPDTYEGCINGCDSLLCEILKVNISTSHTSFSNTQPINRNIITTNQNGGNIIRINDCMLFNLLLFKFAVINY